MFWRSPMMSEYGIDKTKEKRTWKHFMFIEKETEPEVRRDMFIVTLDLSSVPTISHRCHVKMIFEKLYIFRLGVRLSWTDLHQFLVYTLLSWTQINVHDIVKYRK